MSPTTAQLSKGRCQAVAKTAACPAHLDHLANQAGTDDQANQALPVLQASPAAHRRKSASLERLLHASHAHQAKLANQAHKDHPATPAHLVHQETQERTETQAAPAHKVHPAHQETLALMDPVVIPAPQLSALQEPQATPAPLAPMDHLAPLVNPVQLATTAPPEPQVPRAHLAQPANPARTEPPETKAHQVPMDPRESPVYAPSTAPWTVASSSKMAHAAKQPVSRPIISFLQSWPNGYGECLLLLAIHPHLFFFRSSN